MSTVAKRPQDLEKKPLSYDVPSGKFWDRVVSPVLAVIRYIFLTLGNENILKAFREQPILS